MDVDAAAVQIPFQHELVATADTSRRMARAYLHWQLRAMQPIVTLPLVVAAVAILVRGGPVTVERFLGVLFWSALFIFGACAASLTMGYRSSRKNLESAAPAGATLRSGFGEQAFVSANLHSSTQRPYDAVTSIAVVDGCVIMRHRGSQAIHVYPGELFPPEIVEKLGAQVPQPAPTSSPGLVVAAGAVMAVALLVLAVVRNQLDEPRLCGDLRRLDGPLDELRAARDRGEPITSVPDLVSDVGDAYRSIDPPAEIQDEWAMAVEYWDFVELSGRTGRALEPSSANDARFTAVSDTTAFINAYVDDECQRIRRADDEP